MDLHRPGCQCQYITITTFAVLDTHNDRHSLVRQKRGVTPLLARVDVGNVDLDKRDGNAKERITDRDVVVRPRA